MLERIALNQTRLRTPGIGLDGKGVALGSKGLILLPSLDRLVAWLAVYTRERSLEDLIEQLEIELVRSKLGTKEIVVTLQAESSDRMDRIAETSRIVGGFSFTGTSRHFVQYRDANAPFGYDAGQLLSSDAPIVLYHDKFTQAYAQEKKLDIRSLLLRLMPHVDPSAGRDPGPRIIVAERGLGPALIHYFVRSAVEAEVAMAEWPKESDFDDGPIQRYIFKVQDLPQRMLPLLGHTPGITLFVPTGPGIAVEAGFRHPVTLRGCPVFDPAGMIFVRGRGDDPWTVPAMPIMGDVRAFAQIHWREGKPLERISNSSQNPATVRIPLRVSPTLGSWRKVTASWITPSEVPLLRRLAYGLPRLVIRNTKVAITPKGVFLRTEGGIEAIPLGTFFAEVHPQLFVPAGYDFVPAIAPDVLVRALGIPSGALLFVLQDASGLTVEDSAFSPLENMLLEAHTWEPLVAESIERALQERPVELRVEPLGFRPMRDVVPPEDEKHDS